MTADYAMYLSTCTATAGKGDNVPIRCEWHVDESTCWQVSEAEIAS